MLSAFETMEQAPDELPHSLVNVSQPSHTLLLHSDLSHGVQVLGDDGTVGVSAGGVKIHSDTESDSQDEDDEVPDNSGGASGDGNGGHALKGDEAWTEIEEQELARLATDEAYRKEKLGEGSTKWGPIAVHFQRTIKAVKRKFDKLQNGDRDSTRRSRLPKQYPEAAAVLQRIQAQQAQQQLAAQQHQQQFMSHPMSHAMSGHHMSHSMAQLQLPPQHEPHLQHAQLAEHMQHAQLDEHQAQQLAALHHHQQQQQQLAQQSQHHGQHVHISQAQHAQHMQHAHGIPLLDPMGPPATELLAGIYMDPHSLNGGVPMLSPHHLSAEDAAALQVMQPMSAMQMSQAMSVPMGSMALHAAAAGGHMVQQMGAVSALDAALQAHAAAAASAGGGGHVSGDAVALHQAAQMQMLHHNPVAAAAAAAAVAAAAAAGEGGGQGGGGGSGPAPKKDRQFWRQSEQQELLRLATDPLHRQQLLGTPDLNWDLIAKQLGRGKRSVQRKYDNLRTGMHGGMTSGLPSKDGQKWTAEETAELSRLVEDPAYLKERLGLDKIDWRVLGQHFNRSYETVSYKVSYMKNTQRKAAVGPDGQVLEGRQHKKARHETSYKDMAAHALQLMPGLEGTSGEICAIIASTPQYASQLDMAIVSGKKTLPRWKHGVRSALNAFNIFERTSALREGEVVWRLNTSAVAQEQMNQAEKQERLRNKPLSGAQRRKSRKEREEAAVHQAQLRLVEIAEQQEEGAQQALAQLAQQAQEDRPRRKRKGSPSGHGEPGGGLEEEGGGAEGDREGGGGGRGAHAGQGGEEDVLVRGASGEMASQHAQQGLTLQEHLQHLHPDTLAAIMAQPGGVLDPALLQALTEQAQQAGLSAEQLQGQEQFQATQQAQQEDGGAQQAQQLLMAGEGYGAPGASTQPPALLAGVPPELQQQYQNHIAQQYLLYHQQQQGTGGEGGEAGATGGGLEGLSPQHAQQHAAAEGGGGSEGADPGMRLLLQSQQQGEQHAQHEYARQQGEQHAHGAAASFLHALHPDQLHALHPSLVMGSPALEQQEGPGGQHAQHAEQPPQQQQEHLGDLAMWQQGAAQQDQSAAQHAQAHQQQYGAAMDLHAQLAAAGFAVGGAQEDGEGAHGHSLMSAQAAAELAAQVAQHVQHNAGLGMDPPPLSTARLGAGGEDGHRQH